MSDAVTSTGSIVGFTHDRHNCNYGISDKDQGFASVVDAGERTRDVLRFIYDGIVATEKTGAASVLATEKIGAAAILAAEKIGFQTQLQSEHRHNATLLAMQDMRREMTLQIERCCCDIKATVLAVDAQRVRDDLAQCRAELIAAGHGNQ